MAGNGADSTIIRLDKVSVTYRGGVKALRATSIAFGRGEFVVLLGRSGAGKSTLLRAINHLVPRPPGKSYRGSSASSARGICCASTGGVLQLSSKIIS
jgi:ABC-type phosphate/phosphonate transport system ATPase subunit